uniref:EGF-like domain-containing protein n=1 Tax=Oryza nivara TaxID=4536 RepID=A0A0E0IQ25_ORYNI
MICPWSVAAAAVALLLLSPGENQMVRVSAQPTKTRCAAGVVDTCGDVGVPYPFGIDGGSCSFLPGFNLTCDRTKQPHRLFLGDGSHLQVTEISLANYTVRVLNGVGTVNFTFAGHNDSTAKWAGVGVGQDDGPYIVSEEHNQLVVTGCNIMASLLGNSGSNVIIGCSSFCSITDWWGADPIVHSGAGGACSGLGCCDVNITIGRPSYDLQLRWLDWDHNYDDLLPIAVRIAERGWFDGMSTKLLRKNSRSAVPVPVVLEWAVASVHKPPTPVDVNSTCPKDPARSECRSSNSFCRNIANMYRSGYVCKCDDGYQGNPYLTGGCQDIDECSLPGKCFGECTNTPGNYSCRCPRGARGNPYTKDGCIKFPLVLDRGG